MFDTLILYCHKQHNNGSHVQSKISLIACITICTIIVIQYTTYF